VREQGGISAPLPPHVCTSRDHLKEGVKKMKETGRKPYFSKLGPIRTDRANIVFLKKKGK